MTDAKQEVEKEVEYFEQKCPLCDGNGTIKHDCEECDGSGEIICDWCDGCGGLECESCGGEGCNECVEGTVDCQDCWSGVLDCGWCEGGSNYENCEECNGTGWVWEER